MKNLEQRKLHKLSGQCVSFRRPCYLVLKFVAGANSSGVRPEALRPSLSVGLPFSETHFGIRSSVTSKRSANRSEEKYACKSEAYEHVLVGIHGFDVQICEEGPTKIVAS